MDIHSKDGLVFMVQADHLSGECVGQAIGHLYTAGAANVQVVPAITKKNRPSYLFFIDCRPDSADRVEAVSYTHLDVYKRQAWQSAQRRRWPSAVMRRHRSRTGADVWSPRRCWA